MDARDVAGADAKEARWRRATLWAGLGGVVWLFLVIAVLSTQRTPLPWWVVPLFWTIPLAAVAVLVIGTVWLRARRTATVMALQDAADALRTLADEIEAVQRETRHGHPPEDPPQAPTTRHDTR